nr:hypothetical protein CFP56_75542 [Quercus suber]
MAALVSSRRSIQIHDLLTNGKRHWLCQGCEQLSIIRSAPSYNPYTLERPIGGVSARCERDVHRASLRAAAVPIPRRGDVQTSAVLRNIDQASLAAPPTKSLLVTASWSRQIAGAEQWHSAMRRGTAMNKFFMRPYAEGLNDRGVALTHILSPAWLPK